MTGRDGKDVIIEVPLGTVARDAESEIQEAEILEDGQNNCLDQRRKRRTGK
jgi:GTP-binding protein